MPPEVIRIHADEASMVALADLRPYEHNALDHDPEQIEALARVIEDSGFTNPVLIDASGTIVAGHGRVLAASRLGMPAVPCVVLKGLSDDQIRALRISDNETARRSTWDFDLLRLELGDLKAQGISIDLAGFTKDALKEIMAKPRRVADPDIIPDTPDQPTSRAGDLWELGDHRLICGDCTDAATVQRVLGAHVPNLMVTDPPYGVAYDPTWRVDAGLSGAAASGLVMNDDRADWREAWALFPGDIAYVWHAGVRAHEVIASLEACKFTLRSQIIWAKTQLVISRGHYHVQHEPALYAVRKYRRAGWRGDRKQSTVWQMEHRRSDTGHGTQKPVEAMRRPIENSSAPGDRVYEPFSGSGTTVIAAEMTGRIAHALELDPKYVDVAVERWQAYAGKSATLADDGRTFAEIKEQRSPMSRTS